MACNSVLEVKISKTQKVLLRPFKFHEKQTQYYMAIQGSDEGQMIYQLDHHGKYISFPIYMNAEERKQQLKTMEEEAELLLNAIKAGDPSLVPGFYNDEQLKWMCLRCPYLEKCQLTREI